MANTIGECSFKVTPEELQKQAENILNTSKIVRTKFEDLLSRVNGSSGYWEGIAAESFRSQCLEYQKTLEDILASLTEHATDLKDIAMVYTNVEQFNNEITEDLPGDIIM